jgi:hypothetical protein
MPPEPVENIGGHGFTHPVNEIFSEFDVVPFSRKSNSKSCSLAAKIS